MTRSRSVAPAALALTTLLAALTLSVPARANDSLQGKLDFAAGWTDNVLAQPVGEQDAIFQLRPGVVYTHGGARSLIQLGDTFSADLYALHSNGNSYTNRLYWTGLFQLTRKTQIFTQLDADVGKLNALNSLADSATAAAAGAQAPGGTVFFDTSARESIYHDFTPNWRLDQVGSFRVFVPLVSENRLPVSWDGLISLGIDRTFKKDAVGVDFRAEYIQYDDVRDATDTVVVPTQREMVLTLLPHWRRDWTAFWSTELAAGAVMAFRVETNTGVLVEPSGLAALRYTRSFMTGELSYSHNVTANPYVGQTYVVDNATLRGFFPFPQRTKMAFAVTGSYQHARSTDALPVLDTAGMQIDTSKISYDVVMADATLSWKPRPEIAMFLRYDFYEQFATPERSFQRNRIMLGVSAIFPATAAVAVPQRPGTRVDRSDMSIPEPHSPPPEK